MKFFFRNLRNIREDNTEHKYTTFGFDNEKNVPMYFAKIELFSISKLKLMYLRPFLSSLRFPKFWKQNFMYFGHKHVET